MLVAPSHLAHHGVGLPTRELLLGWASDGFVVAPKSQNPLRGRFQGAKVLGGEQFTLHDRKVDLELSEPFGVHRLVDGNHPGG